MNKGGFIYAIGMEGTSVDYLNVAPKLWRSPIRIKKQWLANTIRFSNRYPLRQRTFHLPASSTCKV
jgi:hypothetical protein